MDPEPAPVSQPPSQAEGSTPFSHEGDSQGAPEEDPFSLSGPSIALLGITIAIAAVGIPLVAVLTERPIRPESMVPTALESDGSKSSLPISLTRFGEPYC